MLWAMSQMIKAKYPQAMILLGNSSRAALIFIDNHLPVKGLAREAFFRKQTLSILTKSSFRNNIT